MAKDIWVSPICNYMFPYERDSRSFDTDIHRKGTQTGRGWSDVALVQGVPPEATRIWKNQGMDFSLEPSEGVQHC